MSKKCLLIINANSGKGEIKDKLFYLVNHLSLSDFEVTIYITKGPSDAINKVQSDAMNYDYIVCSGGDGTLNETVSGLMAIEKKPIVGYIPAGTVNDFATSLKISKNIVNSTKTISDGIPFACDIGSFNNRFFTYIAAFGAFTDVSYKTPQESKNIMGRLAYILEGIKRIHTLKSYKLRLTHDDTIIEDEFIYGMITNTTSVGGFKGIHSNDVQMDDGLFEVMLIKKPSTALELQSIINNLLKIETDCQFITFFKADHITLDAPAEMCWTLDGEYGGNPAHIDIYNHKQAINIMVDK